MELLLLRPLVDGVGRVTQWFGENPEVYAPFKLAGHNGIDYGAPEGSPVLAAHAGLCTAGFDPEGYGHWLRIADLDSRFVTLYAHMSELLVKSGEPIKAGQQVGYVGSTGFSTGPHLHWGLKLTHGRSPAYRDWTDPVPFRLAAAQGGMRSLGGAAPLLLPDLM